MLIFSKDYIFTALETGRDLVYLIIGSSTIFVTIYIHRYFFRPGYEDITNLKKKGWNITGYYSKKSLKDEKVYLKSYLNWVKLNLTLLLGELIIFLAYYLVRGKLDIYEVYFHFALVLGIQIVSWIITNLREKDIA